MMSVLIYYRRTRRGGIL